MESCQKPDAINLSENRLIQIKADVRQAAINHLNAKDAATALSHYTKDVITVSNVKFYPSFEMLAEDVKAYYNILKRLFLQVKQNVRLIRFKQ